MKSELAAIHERTLSALKEVRALRSMANLSDHELERLACLLVELSELCPPERFAWVDGLPVIDVVAELVKIEHERKLLHMKTVEERKKMMTDALLEKLESASKNAIAGFESAKIEVARLQESLVKYKARESEIESQLQIAKMEARQSFESGKDIGTLTSKAGDLKSELEVVRESVEEIEDIRLPAARQAMDDVENALGGILCSVAAEYRIEVQEEFDRHVAELEVLLEAWPKVGYELHRILKKKSFVPLPPLAFSSGPLVHSYYPR